MPLKGIYNIVLRIVSVPTDSPRPTNGISNEFEIR